MLIFAVLTGILGSSMSLLAPVWIVFVAFALALVAGATAWLWFSGDRFYQALSIAGVLYIASLVGQARNSAIAALAAIKLRFDNIDLVRQAEAARSAAEQANLAKSKFLAAASHDLRQPVTSMSLLLSALHAARDEQAMRAIAARLEALQAPEVDAIEDGLVDALLQLQVGPARGALHQGLDELELAVVVLGGSQAFAK